jgi:hypothetical protein
MGGDKQVAGDSKNSGVLSGRGGLGIRQRGL